MWLFLFSVSTGLLKLFSRGKNTHTILSPELGFMGAVIWFKLVCAIVVEVSMKRQCKVPETRAVISLNIRSMFLWIFLPLLNNFKNLYYNSIGTKTTLNQITAPRNLSSGIIWCSAVHSLVDSLNIPVEDRHSGNQQTIGTQHVFYIFCSTVVFCLIRAGVFASFQNGRISFLVLLASLLANQTTLIAFPSA